MSLKNEKMIDRSVKKMHKKWERLKGWGQKNLLIAVSSISLSAGMTAPTQMQAQTRGEKEVPVEQLASYLNGLRRTSNEGPTANTAHYQNQKQHAYGSAGWLKDHNYLLDFKLSRNINHERFIGAFLDGNTIDRYGIPTHVVYLPIDPIHDKPIRVSMENARQMVEHPGGDTLGVYLSPNGTDLNNPENNHNPWGFGRRGHGSKGERIARGAADAILTAARIAAHRGR